MTERPRGRAWTWTAVAVLCAAALAAPGPAPILAQAPAAPQSPAPPDAAPGGTAGNAQDQPVFRAGVKLVLVDVSVTGPGDEPLTDLTPEDFELTEDGVQQTVEQATLVQLDGQPRGDGEALEIRSQSHALAEAARDDVRLFAVFMDDYHLGRYPREMLPLRKALTDFLDTMMGPLDLVTVMNPITPLSALEWTRDRARLVREIKTYEGRNDNLIGRSPLEESQNLSRNPGRVRSQVVISALRALVMHLSGLREGRKTLLVVSQGIPLTWDISLEPDFQDLLREANRGNVVIHTLDPRGLGQGTFVHSTLYRLASETGGQAIVNTNNLTRGLEQVVRDASHYYLIGYAPTREPNDGKFHKISVKVRRRGVKTVARRGYWAPSAEEMTPSEPPAIAPAVGSALTNLEARRDNRVAHVETGFSPGAAGHVRLTATWRPVDGFKDPPTRLRLEVHDDQGTRIGTAEDALGDTGTGVVSLELPPGDVVVRFSATGESGDVVDRWEAPLTVPDLAGAAVALATPQFVRALTTAAYQGLRRGGPGPPSPDREFRTTDLVVVRTAVTGEASDAASVTAEVLTREGKVLASLPSAAVAGRRQVELPVRALALGEYVLRFTATSGTESAEATAGFAIVR
ncbi:MAG: VWA domain-containing protein [Vicinamibacterales bacterium]